MARACESPTRFIHGNDVHLILMQTSRQEMGPGTRDEIADSLSHPSFETKRTPYGSQITDRRRIKERN